MITLELQRFDQEAFECLFCGRRIYFQEAVQPAILKDGKPMRLTRAVNGMAATDRCGLCWPCFLCNVDERTVGRLDGERLAYRLRARLAVVEERLAEDPPGRPSIEEWNEYESEGEWFYGPDEVVTGRESLINRERGEAWRDSVYFCPGCGGWQATQIFVDADGQSIRACEFCGLSWRSGARLKEPAARRWTRFLRNAYREVVHPATCPPCPVVSRGCQGDCEQCQCAAKIQPKFIEPEEVVQDMESPSK
jgi:transcription elongation factor Elf1